MGGISGLLGALALLGFLGFLGGIGLVVVAASQGRPMRGGAALAVAGLVIGLLFSVISQGILIVEPTQVAVVFQTISGELEEPRRAGTHIIIPVLQSASIYPIEQQEFTMAGERETGVIVGDDGVRGRTVDGQEVFVDVTVIFSISPADVNLVHVRWQDRYRNDLIRPTLRGLARDAISRFTAEGIFGERRTELGDSLEELMRTRLAEEGIILTDLLIRDVTFTTEFSQSIEARQIAEQEAQRARFRVQQEQQEAERVRVRAQGARDAEIARAEGDAQGIILRAQAQAEALRLVSEQIAANPSLIQYEYIQRLSENISLALVPTNSPFLFDFESLAQANPGFTAPEVPQATLPEVGDEDVIVPDPAPAPGG